MVHDTWVVAEGWREMNILSGLFTQGLSSLKAEYELGVMKRRYYDYHLHLTDEALSLREGCKMVSSILDNCI